MLETKLEIESGVPTWSDVSRSTTAEKGTTTGVNEAKFYYKEREKQTTRHKWRGGEHNKSCSKDQMQIEL